MTDPFFEAIEDREWNACVGVQGTAFAYVDGYLEAARILVATVIDDELIGSRDSLIMPILYNTRHGLELALKYVTERLERLELMQAREGAVDHDILAYWRRLRDADVIDLQSRTAIAALEPYVAKRSAEILKPNPVRAYRHRSVMLCSLFKRLNLNGADEPLHVRMAEYGSVPPGVADQQVLQSLGFGTGAPRTPC